MNKKTNDENNQRDQDRELVFRKLKFNARRGMLELDLILQSYLQNNFSRMLLSNSLINEFEKLMNLSDPELWDILVLKNKHQYVNLSNIIIDIINNEDKSTEN